MIVLKNCRGEATVRLAYERKGPVLLLHDQQDVLSPPRFTETLANGWRH